MSEQARVSGDVEVPSSRSSRSSRSGKRHGALFVTESVWNKDADLNNGAASKKGYGVWDTLALAFTSLGIVYGDIGTSPLYVYDSTFLYGTPSRDDILGAASIIFYFLTLIVLVNYVLIVLRADDHGEGGTFALYSLLCRHLDINPMGQLLKSDRRLSQFTAHVPDREAASGRTGTYLRKRLQRSPALQVSLMVLVALATSMVLGDGVLTPTISVLSAVSGLKVAAPGISTEVVVWVAIAILVLLFLPQQFGTYKVGFTFAPVVALWFLGNVSVATFNLVTYGGEAFKALNPYYAFLFFVNNGAEGWMMLGGLMLAVTGAEAMFADLGHFNRTTISLSWCFFTYPCLVLTYLGQAAALLHDPSILGQTFWKAMPSAAFYPMLVLATLASVVASQALITGVFSIVRQAINLGMLPRLTIKHTAAKFEGQVYIPSVNYLLLILCVAVVGGFQSTTALGNAYGVAVITVMVITTFLVTLILLVVWNRSVVFALPYLIFFGSLQLVILSATLHKVPEGGWVTIMMAAVVLLIELVWCWGSQRESGPAATASHLEWSAPKDSLARVPGMGIYYSKQSSGVPPVVTGLMANLPALHGVSVFLTVRQLPVPHVRGYERFLVRKVDGLRCAFTVVARYGYMDVVRVADAQFSVGLVAALLEHLNGLIAVARRGPGDDAPPSQASSEDGKPAGGDLAAAVAAATAAATLSDTDRTDAAAAGSASALTVGGPPIESMLATVPWRLSELQADVGVVANIDSRKVVHVVGRSELAASPGTNAAKHVLLSCYTTLKLSAVKVQSLYGMPSDRVVEVSLFKQL